MSQGRVIEISTGNLNEFMQFACAYDPAQVWNFISGRCAVADLPPEIQRLHGLAQEKKWIMFMAVVSACYPKSTHSIQMVANIADVLVWRDWLQERGTPEENRWDRPHDFKFGLISTTEGLGEDPLGFHLPRVTIPASLFHPRLRTYHPLWLSKLVCRRWPHLDEEEEANESSEYRIHCTPPLPKDEDPYDKECEILIGSHQPWLEVRDGHSEDPFMLVCSIPSTPHKPVSKNNVGVMKSFQSKTESLIITMGHMVAICGPAYVQYGEIFTIDNTREEERARRVHKIASEIIRTNPPDHKEAPIDPDRSMFALVKGPSAPPKIDIADLEDTDDTPTFGGAIIRRGTMCNFKKPTFLMANSHYAHVLVFHGTPLGLDELKEPDTSMSTTESELQANESDLVGGEEREDTTYSEDYAQHSGGSMEGREVQFGSTTIISYQVKSEVSVKEESVSN